MNALDSIKNTANGLATLKDWLGDGLNHVSQEQADRRSKFCQSGNEGGPCSHNRAEKWWEKSKSIVADAMRSQMEIKNGCRITTPNEEKLHICDICGCCLPLKIHVPISHIRAHTSPELIQKMPGFCWIKTEMEQS